MADNFFSDLNNFSGINFPINLMEFSIENLLLENFPFHDNQIISSDDVCRKRKELSTPANSSSVKNNASGRGKKAKRDEGKATEVVHVRAKRGQATDNHSLAERVRRQKINEKLRFLQDIVPGCNKNMGMAVMLDEIINYVQSLQNQVEFLSMKLTAASMETDALERAKAVQAFNNHNSFF